MKQYPKPLMSNYDHEISRDVETYLRANPHTWAAYLGWNFHGRVWCCADDEWCCEVWILGVPRKIIKSDSPEGIMTAMSARYGEA